MSEIATIKDGTGVMANTASTEFVVLFVCQANQIRSVMGERLLGDALQRNSDSIRAPQTGLAWRITSAGVNAEPDRPAPDHVREVLRACGIDASDHRSTLLSADDVRDADLILTAERAHRSAVVALDPLAVHRTFTIRQFGRVVPADHPIEYSLKGGLALCDYVRTHRHLHTAADPADDDIADPVGRSVRTFRETAATIADALTAFGVSRPSGNVDHEPRRRWGLRRRSAPAQKVH